MDTVQRFSSPALRQRAGVAAGDARDTAARTALIIQVMSVVALLVAVAVSFFFSRMITRPVRALAAGARRLAEGDLRVELPRYPWNDEMGDLTRSFGSMLASLCGVITSLSSSSQELTASSEGLSLGAQQVTQAAQEIKDGTLVAAMANLSSVTEQTTASSLSLAHMSQSLQEQVNRFQL